jgi:hypothetical protein
MDGEEANKKIAKYLSELKEIRLISQNLSENKTVYFEGGRLNFSLERAESGGGSVSKVRSFEGVVLDIKRVEDAKITTRDGEKKLNGNILEITLDSKEHAGNLLIFYIRPDEKGWIDVDINMRKKENKNTGAMLIR